jgi:hypothetical protein
MQQQKKQKIEKQQLLFEIEKPRYYYNNDSDFVYFDIDSIVCPMKVRRDKTNGSIKIDISKLLIEVFKITTKENLIIQKGISGTRFGTITNFFHPVEDTFRYLNGGDNNWNRQTNARVGLFLKYEKTIRDGLLEFEIKYQEMLQSLDIQE